MNTDYFADYRNQYTIKHRASTQTLPRYSAECKCGVYTSNAQDINELIEMLEAHKHNEGEGNV